ncbi:class I SAM-dependent methyltransferase [Sphingosinicella sp. CPCC 101087]|uniref:class I SAM-dependent methyltransferase n=1 Tax=Sphingosinicella sp. CPCC 101087 TaxID=2497754 RepID=UPI001981571A|nr:class I SAM-dependent methyltransferase [Sphingosinicella sp. CPCC 101087]
MAGAGRWAAALLAAAAMLSSCGETAGTDANKAAAAIPALPDPANVPAYVQAALDDTGRAAQRGADERRKPGALVTLSGLKPGDRVLDLIPGNGYWTRIFSRIVGPEGRVYAVWPEHYARFARGNVAELEQMATSDAYSNVTVQVQPTPILTAPEPLDMVWTSQNYHDYPAEFMGRTDPAQLNRAVFDMLKPGGTWFIIDHAAEPGSGLRDAERLHRIDPQIVRRQVEQAGFEYVGSSDVLSNPGDDHAVTVFDPAIRGRTDQFVMRFRKPPAR